MDEIQPPLEEKINIDDLVLSSNQNEMQDDRNDSVSIEIKQEQVEYHTKFLHVENENTLLRKKLEEITANFTKSEVEKDKLTVELTNTKQELEKTKMENKRLTSQVKELINPVLTSKQEVAEILKESLKEGNELIEKDELIIQLAETKLELQRSQIRNEKLKSQNQKYKEKISVLIPAQDEGSKEIQFQEQDTVSNDHLDAVKIPENESDLKTDDQSKVRDQATVVKIPIQKKNKHLKIKSNDGEQKNDIDENATTLEEIAKFDEGNKKKQRKCVKRSKATMVFKPYSCDYCSKSFRRKGHKKRHERIHTGERPYPCNICGKCFNRSYSLKLHESIHSGELPYSCTICEKSFCRSSILKAHERIHTGEKPYSCDYCSKSFRQKGHMKSHERIHTGEKKHLKSKGMKDGNIE